MYKINTVLKKPGIVRPSYFTTQSGNVFSRHGNASKIHRAGHRLMSTASNNGKNSIIGYSAAAGVLFGTTVTLAARYSDSFRDSIEDTIPYTKQAFQYLIPKDDAASVIKEVETLLPFQSLPTDIEIHDGKRKEDHLVVNIMDTPTPSSIDLELGKEEPKGLSDPLNESVSEASSNELPSETTGDDETIHDLEKEALEAIVETAIEIIEDVIPGAEIVLEFAEEIADLPKVSEKIEEIEESIITTIEEKVAELAEDISAFIDAPLSLETTTESHSSTILSNGQLNTVLTVAYENLRIILDDTVTTKTSAAGMLHGYLNQFGQALLISNDDPAYKSVWDAAATLEHNVMDSVALVKAKEAEAKLQMDKLLELIKDVREFGTNEVADRAESLITIAAESLNWGENELVIAKDKLDFLHEFQKRVEGSPEKLKVYLNEFTPDLIKLLQLEKFVEAKNLSNEDALLMLSLKRPEIIYDEVKRREEEMKKEFELSLEEQKNNLLNQAEKSLKNAMELLELNKDDEMKGKIEELILFHANHLQEELNTQADAHAITLETELANHEAELTLRHQADLGEKIDALKEEHNYNVSKNLLSLSGIEAKIGEVIHLTSQQQHNQNLWFAVETLNSVLSNVSVNGRTEGLSPALSDVKQLTKDDEVLTAIIDSIPRGAADMGVIPEDILVQRFNSVKQACMRVAAVKDGSVLSYAFSYIKSFFVLTRFFLNVNAEVDVNTIGPYEILEKADYYIKNGDLVQAAKFMSLLNGVPRKLCADWLNEVLLLLETKQSLSLLLAYSGSFIANGE